MATKYQLLAALIEAESDNRADDVGWHWVLMGVVNRLGETHGSEEALAEELFNFISDSVLPDEDDEAIVSTGE
ncbi:hypothetical protein DEJ00_12700 [Curtobacterium sp. MCLR17_039]|uniref:hypothetical protein n=1 Tax=Curtobacterium sp. MCLR17_039 TaxID=2175624 RepID=UPI000DA7CE7D|nr:hypothetical protein [Curtobacterium sp. MCLR17_039]PZE88784.1 hypothetical protein DEJ00_12700 [Curtobacterium sp. MCLR17_039]